MFLELNMHKGERALRDLSEVLLSFFHYAARQGGTNLDRVAFRRDCPDFADWFLGLLDKKTANGARFRSSVRALFLLPGLRRARIYCALKHDCLFACAACRKGYHFWALGLRDREKKLLHDFYFYFYDVVFRHKQAIRFSSHLCEATRAAVRRRYFSDNPDLAEICPVCLRHKTDAVHESDLEHYLTKSVYPWLILHPYNLYFTCKECNQVYKGDKDVLKDKNDLGAVFLPYLDVVQREVVIVIERCGAQDMVWLKPKDGAAGDLEEKAARFDDAYQLSSRWTKDFRSIYQTLRREFSSQGGDKKALRALVGQELKRLERRGELPEHFVETAYSKWILTRQLDAFLEEVTRDM